MPTPPATLRTPLFTEVALVVPFMLTKPLYSASLISPLSSTSKLGIPETSLTENIVPANVSLTANNCPDVPSKLSVDTVPEFMTLITIVALDAVSAPLRVIIGSEPAPLLGVIIMSRSLSAIV